ncbi:MAG TPA: 4-(cytidine 5'-diphospho)-2-C-methyl-D-erythritol kinase [Candidatus Acidoferrales bacterium]|nr:4-(cytidine 5'-diphospho)-2-C-methyl-D-erythritol kinase [Candidatus Acidoferrales bacterium]
MREIRVPAYAKVNLRLEILGKREDGFHELRTIFQTISLHDEVRLRLSRKPRISLTIQGNQSLAAEPIQKNLVYRAVQAVRRETRRKPGVEIELRKSIPAGRGLGGGSSDAAAALLGYLRLTRQQLPVSKLIQIAASLGADVPFFLFGGSALGVNKGDEIYPLPDLGAHSLLVVSPQSVHVPTPDAYRWLRAPRLTKSAANPKLWGFCALCWSAPGTALSNDFEGAVFRRHPRLGIIKRELLRRGATEALLAGSGSAVFGIFPSPAKARRAAVGFPDDQTFVCETISRDRYAQGLKRAP